MCCRRNFINECAAPCESGALFDFKNDVVWNGTQAVPYDYSRYSFKYRPV